MADMIMGYVSDTNDTLLSSDEADYSMLTEEDHQSNDVSRLHYTDHDKKTI